VNDASCSPKLSSALLNSAHSHECRVDGTHGRGKRMFSPMETNAILYHTV
jgi:hypothetical protein